MRPVLVLGAVALLACTGIGTEDAVVEGPKPLAGPTTLLTLEGSGAECSLWKRTVPVSSDRKLATVPRPCPIEPTLVLHPDGSRALVHDASGTALYDLRSGGGRSLPDAPSELVPAGFDGMGRPLGFTWTAAEYGVDARGAYLVAGDEEVPFDAVQGAEAVLAQVWALDGAAWRKERLEAAFRTGSAVPRLAAQIALELTVGAPVGAPLTVDPPGAGSWGSDGTVAYRLEDGRPPLTPLGVRAGGSWRMLPGFEGSGVEARWTVRNGAVWVESGAAAALFDAGTGESLWIASGPAWLAPAGWRAVEPGQRFSCPEGSTYSVGAAALLRPPDCSPPALLGFGARPRYDADYPASAQERDVVHSCVGGDFAIVRPVGEGSLVVRGPASLDGTLGMTLEVGDLEYGLLEADVGGLVGEYHWSCPEDAALFCACGAVEGSIGATGRTGTWSFAQGGTRAEVVYEAGDVVSARIWARDGTEHAGPVKGGVKDGTWTVSQDGKVLREETWAAGKLIRKPVKAPSFTEPDVAEGDRPPARNRRPWRHPPRRWR